MRWTPTPSGTLLPAGDLNTLSGNAGPLLPTRACLGALGSGLVFCPQLQGLHHFTLQGGFVVVGTFLSLSTDQVSLQ